MKISTKGRYALIVMVDIATHDEDGYVSISDISKRCNISNKYLEQITSYLKKADLLEISRGKNGGYRLKKDPSKIKAGDILRVSEGKLEIMFCDYEGETCLSKKGCLVKPFWKKLEKRIYEFVDSYTLEDIIEGRI